VVDFSRGSPLQGCIGTRCRDSYDEHSVHIAQPAPRGSGVGDWHAYHVCVRGGDGATRRGHLGDQSVGVDPPLPT
jgi:hypothetical protein